MLRCINEVKAATSCGDGIDMNWQWAGVPQNAFHQPAGGINSDGFDGTSSAIPRAIGMPKLEASTRSCSLCAMLQQECCQMARM